MTNLFLLVFCLVLGAFLRRIKDFPENSPMVLNQFLIYISLPALALIYIPQITLSRELLFPVATSWLVLGFALIIIPLLGRLFGWSRETVGCLLLTAGLGNTSFVGFPVIEAVYGPEALRIALMVDQPGSFVAVSTAGIIIACTYSDNELRKRDIFRKVLLFPPFITFVFAIGMNLAGIEARGIPLEVLERLGATLAPIALTSVGMQLSFSLQKESVAPLIWGLSYKLLLAPLLLSVLFIFVLQGSGEVVKVSIMEAAMAPMITGSILAIMYGLNPKLASQMVGIGVPLSFLTLFGWYYILEWLG
ncbi:MAG: AEC family transporter [Candidatus Cyclonatronum sp.]|uniref:AEC family transporter n=1 Tax=Cyclonatronum sp. TaxID=3024185 RepID=UPI0025BE2BDF|nr:AEC family transporter [Cyclonatronum sp.]MCC5934202.1 AEC family transporter [Balneolales bacterium]MCH8487039.1 AEC family transporter [Cyclonatronum sp.]